MQNSLTNKGVAIMIKSLSNKGIEKEEYASFSCQRRNPAADNFFQITDTEAVLRGFQEGNAEGSFGAGRLNRSGMSLDGQTAESRFSRFIHVTG